MILWWGDGVGNATEENASVFFQILNVLVVVSKGMQAVKLGSNKILEYEG